MKDVVVDKYTALDTASGMILAARGYPLQTAIAFSVAVEIASVFFGPVQNGREGYQNFEQHVLNVLASVIGWTAVRSVRQQNS